MGFDINKAARIMRAGSEFSETNRKLREAVYSFIEWFFQALDGYKLPGEKFGWIFEKKNNQIRVGFLMQNGGWDSITVDGSETQMEAIISFCRALAGPEGKTLLAWLENQTRDRSQLLIALQSGIQTFRSLATK